MAIYSYLDFICYHSTCDLPRILRRDSSTIVSSLWEEAIAIALSENGTEICFGGVGLEPLEEISDDIDGIRIRK